MLRIPRLVPLVPIGMKFVKVKEVISSRAVAERSYWNTSPSSDLSPRQKVRTWIYNSNSNASFSYEANKPFPAVAGRCSLTGALPYCDMRFLSLL